MTAVNLTEAPCDACPRKCRLEIFRNGSDGAAPGADRCLFRPDKTPAWVLGPENPAPAPKIETTTAPLPVTVDRVLLACRGCSAPCLLEITGPIYNADALECHTGYLGVAWRRTL